MKRSQSRRSIVLLPSKFIISQPPLKTSLEASGEDEVIGQVDDSVAQLVRRIDVPTKLPRTFSKK
jgi:hypothetical protein